MSYARLATRLYNTPLLLSAEKLEVLHRVLLAHEEGRAKLLAPYEPKARPEVAAPGQAQRTQSGYLRTADGVAIVPVMGTLVQRTGGMDADSGLTSYDQIGAQVAAAIDDPQVRGILLEVDSSGGEASGNFDLAASIRAAGALKPIFAHVNELALSGGYSIGAAAEALFAPRTGMVGSIGVRMLHVDQSQYDAKRGYVYTDIVSGKHKADLTPHEPLSDADRQWAQDHVDHTARIFIDQVAAMRELEPDAVRATEAGIFHVEEAQALGLIDGVATLGETLQMLRGRITESSNDSYYGMRAAAAAARTFQLAAQAAERDTTMATENTAAAQLAEAQARGFTEGEKAANAVAATKLAEAETKAKANVKAAGDAAQARIAAILGHDEAKERQSAAHHLALKTTQSVEDAVALLAGLPKEHSKNPLADAMAGVSNPRVGADAPGDGEETEAAVVQRIMNAGKPLKMVK